MKFTNTEIERAEKKVQIAIDKMIDLQDMGFGDQRIMRILDELNLLESHIRTLYQYR